VDVTLDILAVNFSYGTLRLNVSCLVASSRALTPHISFLHPVLPYAAFSVFLQLDLKPAVCICDLQISIKFQAMFTHRTDSMDFMTLCRTYPLAVFVLVFIILDFYFTVA